MCDQVWYERHEISLLGDAKLSVGKLELEKS